MKWIREHKGIIRIGHLVALVVAVAGPWSFDSVSVPLPLTCPPPDVRLDDVFCGLPLSLAWFFLYFGELFNIVRELASGAFRFADAVTRLRLILFMFLLFLPVLSTAVLIWNGGGRRSHNLHTIALVIACGLSGSLATMGYFTGGRFFGILWGPWLYMGLTASLFVLEVFALRTPPDLAKKNPPERTNAT